MIEQGREVGLTQRPWISPKLSVMGPLTCDDEDAMISIRIVLENVGNTPAIGIWSEAIMFIAGKSDLDIHAERLRRCEELADRPPEWGDIIFPGKNIVRNAVVSASTTEIETKFTPEIVICVAYRSTLDGEARHFTGVSYSLFKINPEQPVLDVPLLVGENLTADQVRIEMNQFSPVIAQ
jgi:hypothetical protein